ncbi:MAG: PA0069 family radical SAM protein [Hyphomicrobiaceae bacterium]
MTSLLPRPARSRGATPGHPLAPRCEGDPSDCDTVGGTPGDTAQVWRGRGARSNAAGRYEPVQRDGFDEGWGRDDRVQMVPTVVTHERVRTIISRNDSPDISFDRSINPYRGCEHGCIYCYARPTHAYLGLSPGLDFESRIIAKENAAEALRQEFAAPGYRPSTIALGAVTDPYQPVERQMRLTRAILELLNEAKHPVGIVTKSALIARDIDLLQPMASEGLVKVAVSITTLDRKLARSMEPRAATPARRLETVERLAAAGIPVTVMMAPIIPGLNDHEIERLLEAAAGAGAATAGYVLLRLPLELKDLFQEWLATDHPDRAKRVMSLVRQTQGGRDYRSEFGLRQRGSGPIADLIARRFGSARQRWGLAERQAKLRCDLFKPPGRESAQLTLL